MFARDYEGYLRSLMKQCCLSPEDILFVEDIAAWSEKQGIPEHDRLRPLKLVSRNGAGCTMVIREEIPDFVIEERINALRIRSQLKSVADDRADLLNSEKKKLTYLFLLEYALCIPDINDDEIAADDWVFNEMERFGVFRT